MSSSNQTTEKLGENRQYVASGDSTELHIVSNTSSQPRDLTGQSTIPRQQKKIIQTAVNETEHQEGYMLSSPEAVDKAHALISGGARYTNKGTSAMDVQPIPVYVMNRLANAGTKEEDDEDEDNELENMAIYTKDNRSQVDSINQGSKDPFIETFKDDSNTNKWHDFLETVKMPVDMVEEAGGDDSKTIFDQYKLNGRWKGESRLVHWFQNSGGTNTSLSDEYEISSNSTSGRDEKLRDVERGSHASEHEGDRRYKNRARYWIQENRKNWEPKILDNILSNSYIPLVFRLITLILTIVTLGLGANLVKLYSQSGKERPPSPIMTVIVQTVATVYILYTTYDEFTSQPLGLRNPTEKIRLILMDLLFIIFASANLGLAYQELFDSDGTCRSADVTGSRSIQGSICKRQRALTSFLFLILISWCTTLMISIFRVVHVVSADSRGRI